MYTEKIQLELSREELFAAELENAKANKELQATKKDLLALQKFMANMPDNLDALLSQHPELIKMVFKLEGLSQAEIDQVIADNSMTKERATALEAKRKKEGNGVLKGLSSAQRYVMQYHLGYVDLTL